MKRHTMKRTLTLLVLLLTLSWGATLPAMEYGDANALAGLQSGKGVYLINLDNPQKAALYLGIINATHESMAKQKTRPDFILVFVGQSVRFLTTTRESDQAPQQKEALNSIAASVKALRDKGVRLEVCAIATEFFKVPNDRLLPGLEVVGNGFNSLIGYQNKGYALVPVM